MSSSMMTPAERSLRVGPRVSVSSFCFHRELGDTTFQIETPTGEAGVYVIPGHQPPSLDLPTFFELVRSRLGVDAVELCQVQVPGERVDDLLTGLTSAGVSVTAVPIDIGNLATPDRQRRQQYITEIKPWIEVASHLGAPFARVNPGTPGDATPAASEPLVEALAELADYASGRDVTLLVENHGGPSADPDWLLQLLERVGKDRLGLILDTGNLEPMVTAAHARFDGQPLENEADLDFEPLYDAIAKLAPSAAVVHAKSYDITDDGAFSPLDLRRALEIVKDCGYGGPVTVEYEGGSDETWKHTAQTVALVRDVFGR